MNITQMRFTRLSTHLKPTTGSLPHMKPHICVGASKVAVKLYPVFGAVEQKKLLHNATDPALNSIDKALQIAH
jgi:hypothetical protein